MADGRGGRHGTVEAAAAAAVDPRPKGEEATQEKDCRACTDFKSWAKMQRGALRGRNRGAEAKEERRVDYTLPEDCPLDKNQLGKSTWAFLHTMAAYFPDKPSAQEQHDMKTFFNIFASFYPCKPCAADLRDELQENQPDTSSRQHFSQWLCRLHNGVNVKLGKEEFDCSKVDERWRDGWKDGRCN